MVNYTCEYCNTRFSDRSNMYRHQRRSQTCRQAQGLEMQTYTCLCGKSYSRNDNLQRHQQQCPSMIKELNTSLKLDSTGNNDDLVLKVIDKYGEIVKDLQKQITEVTAKPSNQNNRNMVLGNLPPITDEDLQEYLDYLTLDIIQDGAKGYATFAGTYPLKNKVLCTDRSRKKLQYKDADGEITDNGRMLAQRFFQAISERNTAILNEEYANLNNQLQDIITHNRAGDSDVTGILTKATALQDILIKSQNVAQGKDDDFAQEFLSHLTKML